MLRVSRMRVAGSVPPLRLPRAETVKTRSGSAGSGSAGAISGISRSRRCAAKSRWEGSRARWMLRRASSSARRTPATDGSGSGPMPRARRPRSSHAGAVESASTASIRLVDGFSIWRSISVSISGRFGGATGVVVDSTTRSPSPIPSERREIMFHSSSPATSPSARALRSSSAAACPSAVRGSITEASSFVFPEEMIRGRSPCPAPGRRPGRQHGSPLAQVFDACAEPRGAEGRTRSRSPGSSVQKTQPIVPCSGSSSRRRRRAASCAPCASAP